MPTYLTKEYVHEDPFKIMQILDEVCKHRPWFTDYLWEDPQVRRTSASWYLADAQANGKLWEVYKVDGEVVDLVGIMMLNSLDYKIGAQCHFIFFDGELQSKRDLCLNMMQWAFDHLDLEILRVEIPTYAHKLASWARRKLGFRYEAESRPLKWPSGKRPLTRRQAELGSRKYRATYYKGQWTDALLLSITKEEFQQYVRSIHETGEREHSAVPRHDTSSTGLSEEPSE
jgi:RimJ/RimL family protein N-acetyltransferase